MNDRQSEGHCWICPCRSSVPNAHRNCPIFISIIISFLLIDVREVAASTTKCVYPFDHAFAENFRFRQSRDAIGHRKRNRPSGRSGGKKKTNKPERIFPTGGFRRTRFNAGRRKCFFFPTTVTGPEEKRSGNREKKSLRRHASPAACEDGGLSGWIAPRGESCRVRTLFLDRENF